MDSIFGPLAFVVSLGGLYLHYLNSTSEAKKAFITSGKALFSSVRRIVMYAIILLIAIMSAAGIYLFWSSTEPMDRREVVLLILHFMNVTMYGYLAFAIPAKVIMDRREKSKADQEVPG